MGYTNRETFYFGTPGYMRMVRMPIRGMEASPVGWSNGGTYLNGGGYVRRSFDSHKTYDMTWGGSSAPEVAQTIKSYADGTFGRGLIYFQDPTTYTGNVLPARWADPSLALNYEGRGLIYGIEPTATPTPNARQNNLPVLSAVYSGISSTGASLAVNESDTVFIPVAPDKTLFLGAVYTSSTPSVGVFYQVVNADGQLTGSPIRLPESAPSDSVMFSQSGVAGGGDVSGVRLWAGTRPNAVLSGGSLTLTMMQARVVDSRIAGLEGVGFGEGPFGAGPFGAGITQELLDVLQKPWIGGMGHSGCRFASHPTWTTNSGAFGGQVGFTASLVEVGDWYYG